MLLEISEIYSHRARYAPPWVIGLFVVAPAPFFFSRWVWNLSIHIQRKCWYNSLLVPKKSIFFLLCYQYPLFLYFILKVVVWWLKIVTKSCWLTKKLFFQLSLPLYFTAYFTFYCFERSLKQDLKCWWFWKKYIKHLSINNNQNEKYLSYNHIFINYLILLIIFDIKTFHVTKRQNFLLQKMWFYILK